MINKNEETRYKEAKKQVAIEVAKITAGIGVCFLLYKFRKPLEQKLIEPLLKGQNLSLPIRQAQQNPKNLPEIIPEKALTEVITSIQPTPSAAIGKPLLNGGKPFSVKGGIRNLPPTWNASPEKKRLAESWGIPLRDHQTVVNGCIKNKYCA